MPSIRDWHSNVFDERSDWFSWGIVTFQVFTGIHPYKGRHDGYKNSDLEKRMRDNVSVFNKGVHLNAAVRDFTKIPGGLLDWYQRVFEHGERSIPPSPLDTTRTTTIIRQVAPTVSATGALVFEMILAATTDPVIRIYPCGLALRQTGVLQDATSKRYMAVNFTPKAEIIRTQNGYLVADKGSFYHLSDSGLQQLTLMLTHYGVVRSGNRMFAITDQGLTELNLMEMGRPILTAGRTWDTMRNATEWFDGVGVQNSLGAKYMVVPFGSDACAFVRAPELDDVTVVTARAGHRFVSVIGLNKAGEYKKFEFCLDHEYQKYTLWTGDTDSPDLNLAILPSGVCATIVKDGELAIFVPQNGKASNVPDKKITTDMQLSTWGDKVVYIQNGELWWVKKQ
jgi:hypothetical protein